MFDRKSALGHKLRSTALPFNVLFQPATKKEISQRQLRKTRHSYVKERMKQREQLDQENASLRKLLEENSIDTDIYARLKKLLEMGYKQKREETRTKHGFLNNPCSLSQ